MATLFALCCSVLQCAAVCCSVLQGAHNYGYTNLRRWRNSLYKLCSFVIFSTNEPHRNRALSNGGRHIIYSLHRTAIHSNSQQVTATHCTLQHTATDYMLESCVGSRRGKQCVAAFCSVLQCVAVCCSALECVAAQAVASSDCSSASAV